VADTIGTRAGRRRNTGAQQRKVADLISARTADDSDAALLLEALGLIRAPRQDLQPCGTPAAYERHRLAGEDCRVCLDGMAERNRENYAADPGHARELARERMRRYRARQKAKRA